MGVGDGGVLGMWRWAQGEGNRTSMTHGCVGAAPSFVGMSRRAWATAHGREKIPAPRMALTVVATASPSERPPEISGEGA